MTFNRRGPLFLSYRRTCADDLEVLAPVLREMGTPTWQDVADLREEQTEEAIRAVIEGPEICGGLIWLTEDVRHSNMVRSLEIPQLLRRAKADKGFVLVPVLARGLRYEQVRDVVPASDLVDDLQTWNLKRVPTEIDGVASEPPLTVGAAQRVASLVLHRRLVAVLENRPPGEPLLVGLYARGAAPAPPTTDVALHWDHHFRGRHSTPEGWRSRILPALATLRSAVQCSAGGRAVVFEGLTPLPGAFALGHAFMQPLGIACAWRQRFPSGVIQEWSLAATAQPVPMSSDLSRGRMDANDLAVLVAVGGSVEPAFRASHSVLPSFRGVLSIEVAHAQLPITSPAMAVGLAQAIVEEAKKARASLPAPGTVHLFMAGPAGLAFLLGQLCNQLMPVQTYEYDAESTPPYVAAARVGQCEAIRPLSGADSE